MNMTHQQLRDTFSSFWKKRSHVEVPPIPLVLENDPTTLFTGSGMQQLVPYLSGQEHPLGTRLYNIQRSFRSQDIEEVGDNRHTTFFEMMGNWSLGDYFKEEQLSWVWEYLTKELHLSPEKLYVSCFEGNSDVPKDAVSERIWKKLGLQDNHILFYDAKKNWWSRAGEPKHMPAGEIGGPDSEVFYDFGEELKLHEQSAWKHTPCHPNCDCGRFLEIGNSVFIQYKKNPDGSLSELPKKNVDFGGGLERQLAAVNNDPDVFRTDALWPIVESIQQLSGKHYDPEHQPAMRVIADHMRASVLLIADGVRPSNTEQGYVLRRMIRRAVRFAAGLNLSEGFTTVLAKTVGELLVTAYPHIMHQQRIIASTLLAEEQKFKRTLSHGLQEFDRMVSKNKRISGKDAFLLYESYGFPVEITSELATEKGISIDLEGFSEEKQRHQNVSRKGLDKKFKGGLADQSEQTIKLHTATHLLHQALRDILGTHVQQKGSNITAERLRFDFSHTERVTDEQVKQIEKIVNEKITLDLPVSKKVTTYNEAIAEGALAFFGERYPEKVNVYTIGDYSKEICGGPHVEHTQQLGRFSIQKEQSAGSGLRRMYAILE